MIKIEHVSVSYQKTRVLDDISLDFEEGKTHVIIGSSGSGKSTLLRSILGLVPIHSGTIKILNEDISAMSPARRAAQVGYVPQGAELFPHLTIEKNITLAARSLHWKEDAIQARLEVLNKVVNLGNSLGHRYPHEISGGQMQRAALQRALFLDPQVIVMDEPFGALDPIIRSDVQNEVKELFNRLKKTVIFVTHDLAEAQFLADQVILLNSGKVLQAGNLLDLIKNPADQFVTRFIQAQRVVTHA